MDYKNSDLPWCANCIYGVPEENGNNIYCKQIEGWRIEDDFCGLHEWRNTIIRGIVEGKGNMERLTYKTNGKYLNTTAEQAPPYAIDCDIDTAITKLAEYENLEEQGRLLKLRVPIGTLVYEPYQFVEEGAWEIDVHKIRLEDLDKIGKTVFLTREEAKSALEKLERGKGNEQ